MNDIEYYNKVLALISGHKKEKNLKRVPQPMRTRLLNELNKLEKYTLAKLDTCNPINQ